MKNTVFTFAFGIVVFGITPDSAISPHLALENCIACPPLIVHAVPAPDVKFFQEVLEEHQSVDKLLVSPFDFQSNTMARKRASFAVSIDHASLMLGYDCRRNPERPSRRAASEGRYSPVGARNSRRALTAVALSNVRRRNFQALSSTEGQCWAPAPLVAVKSNLSRSAKLSAIRTHVVRRPTGGFDQICQHNPEAIKCALRDPSVITIRRRLGARLNQDGTMLVGDFRRFTAGVRVIRSFN